MRKKKRDEGGGGDSWLNTYADMVTLLLTFFAVMLSMSTVNQEKYNAFVKSFSNLPQEVIEEITNPAVQPGDESDTVTAVQGNPDAQKLEEAVQAMNDLYQKLVEYINEHGMSNTVSISKIDQVIFIKFDSSVFFQPDRYVMLPGGKDTLGFIGDGIKEYEDMVDLVTICGHTATVPDNTSSAVSDWMLSGDRAAAVAIFLEDEKKIEPKKMILVGYGKNLPVATNDTEEGRKKNRRVELVIIGAGSDMSFNPYSDLQNFYNLMGNKVSNASSPQSGTTAPETGASAPETSAATPEMNSAGVSANPNVQVGVSPYD